MVPRGLFLGRVNDNACMTFSPLHAPSSVQAFSESSALRRAPRLVLPSPHEQLLQHRGYPQTFRLIHSYSWIWKPLLLSGTCLFSTCFEQLEEVPASCELGKADFLHFALKLSQHSRDSSCQNIPGFVERVNVHPQFL